MKPKIPRTPVVAAPPPHDGHTRPPEAALGKDAAAAFREVEPEGFKDDARWSIEAAVADPEVQDSEGGE